MLATTASGQCARLVLQRAEFESLERLIFLMPSEKLQVPSTYLGKEMTKTDEKLAGIPLRTSFRKIDPFTASFSLFSSFQNSFWLLLIVNKICQWLDSNRGSLVSEATALPTVPQPQPLPNATTTAQCHNQCHNQWPMPPPMPNATTNAQCHNQCPMPQPMPNAPTNAQCHNQCPIFEHGFISFNLKGAKRLCSLSFNR